MLIKLIKEEIYKNIRFINALNKIIKKIIANCLNYPLNELSKENILIYESKLKR